MDKGGEWMPEFPAGTFGAEKLRLARAVAEVEADIFKEAPWARPLYWAARLFVRVCSIGERKRW